MPELTIAQALQLAVEHHQAGRLAPAEGLYRQILAREPKNSDALHLLGAIALQTGKPTFAVDLIREALNHCPGTPAMFSNLGEAYVQLAQWDAAVDCFQSAIAMDPSFVNAFSNLGNAWHHRGQPWRAAAQYRAALAIQPSRPDVHSNLIRILDHTPGYDCAAIQRERWRWNQIHAMPRAADIKFIQHDYSKDRRLRIGYVSPDFRDHAVGFNLIPLFENRDRAAVEVFCYSQTLAPDQITARLRSTVDHWRPAGAWTDGQLAEAVRRDRVDILVDLALHTSRQLAAFAFKAAPIQVSFAGYPGGTGMAAIDYHLTDPHLEPGRHEEEQDYDRPFRLPDSFWCYSPPPTDPLVSSLPAAAGNPFTFGCLNAFCKVNETVLRLWSRVLRQLPTSRLILLAPPGSHRDRTLTVLGEMGIAATRVEFVVRQPRIGYLTTYHRIDLSLDTFPYNGHTTSLDSYWMGVPVVTLVGETPVQRAGLSQLSNLGLLELAAESEEAFVAKALELARDLPRLAVLRNTLRERMRNSPLMDGPGFARNIERAFRQMWYRYLGQLDDH